MSFIPGFDSDGVVTVNRVILKPQFSIEDLEERDVGQFDFRLLGEDPVDGEACWKIESKPREKKVSQYTHSVLWIRKSNYVPARLESYSRDQLVRRLHYKQVENVQGIWSARLLEMEDLKRQSRTVLKLEKLIYNLPVAEEKFTVQALRQEQ